MNEIETMKRASSIECAVILVVICTMVSCAQAEIVGEAIIVHPNGEEPKGSRVYSRKTLLQDAFRPQEGTS